MEINTHIHYTDMTSDLETATGEMSLSCNIYVDTRGASPSEKAQLKVILDNFYKEIRAAVYNVNR